MPKRGSYPGLDFIRIGAALSVALYHLAFWYCLPPVPGSLASLFPPQTMFRWGWVGVEIFFVLSGFVIAFSAEDKTAGQFLTSRALRLYPAVWICATITLIVARLGTPSAASDYARSLVLLPVGPWISDVYWTLSVEVAFYLLVAATILLRMKLGRLALILGLWSSGYWILKVTDFLLGHGLQASLRPVENLLTLVWHGCFFAIGIAAHELVQRRDRTKMLLLLSLCVLAGISSILAHARDVLASEGYGGHAWAPVLGWLFAMSLLAASIRWNDFLRQKLGRLAPFARLLGLATYPFYLVHSEVGRALLLRLLRIGQIGAVFVSIVLILGLSFVIVLLERPLREPLRKLLGARGSRTTAVAADLP